MAKWGSKPGASCTEGPHQILGVSSWQLYSKRTLANWNAPVERRKRPSIWNTRLPKLTTLIEKQAGHCLNISALGPLRALPIIPGWRNNLQMKLSPVVATFMTKYWFVVLDRSDLGLLAVLIYKWGVNGLGSGPVWHHLAECHLGKFLVMYSASSLGVVFLYFCCLQTSL